MFLGVRSPYAAHYLPLARPLPAHCPLIAVAHCLRYLNSFQSDGGLYWHRAENSNPHNWGCNPRSKAGEWATTTPCELGSSEQIAFALSGPAAPIGERPAQPAERLLFRISRNENSPKTPTYSAFPIGLVNFSAGTIDHGRQVIPLLVHKQSLFSDRPMRPASGRVAKIFTSTAQAAHTLSTARGEFIHNFSTVKCLDKRIRQPL